VKEKSYFFVMKVFWRIRRNAHAFGWPGAAAILLLVLYTCFVFFVRNPLQGRIVTLQQEAATLRALSSVKSREQKILNPADQLVEFYRFFPKQDTVSDWMEKLYAAAMQQGLNVEQGEYRLAHDRNSKNTRYDIVLPLKGGYLQIRKFIAQALAEVPTLSLDGISFARQKIGDSTVDAQLRFTLYLGKD
jgi:hypothetical protein